MKKTTKKTAPQKGKAATKKQAHVRYAGKPGRNNNM